MKPSRSLPRNYLPFQDWRRVALAVALRPDIDRQRRERNAALGLLAVLLLSVLLSTTLASMIL
jgi:hypothetical protein